MTSEAYKQEIQSKTEEESRVETVLATLSGEDRANIVIQSFIVGSGSIDAHKIYVFYLCTLFSLTDREGGLLLRMCLSSLDTEQKTKVVRAAYHRHLDTMKNTTAAHKQMEDSATIGNFEAAVNAIDLNMPTVFKEDAFNEISLEEKAVISALPRDFTPSMDSVVVKTLRQICDTHGTMMERHGERKLINHDFFQFSTYPFRGRQELFAFSLH